ncbi:MAG: ABC transporter substrate-binding protein [Spirochaetia bacterium]
MNFTKKLILILIVLFVAANLGFANGRGETDDADPVVRIFGPFGGQDEAKFNDCVVAFEEETGIDVVYEASPDFNTQIMVQVEGGNPPDIAALPQPGLMTHFAGRGHIEPLPQSVIDRIDSNYAPAWRELGSYENNVYGVFHRVNAKSFVWYPRQPFEARGYTEPQTWDEMMDLMDQIVEDGGVPWSIGIESGGATGWPATDWLEDIMLRTAGPEMYDQWVNHEIPFDHPVVVRAAEIMANIWLEPDYVLGGTNSIRATSAGDAVLSLFSDPPQAWLHRQGNFIIGNMPQNVRENIEEFVGVFPLPPIDTEWGTPVLGGGDQFVMFNDRPEVVQFMEYLTTWEACEPWAEQGGALFPHQDQDISAYSTEIDQALAQILLQAEVFKFDASDQMPAEVGAGSFWSGMADFVSGVPIEVVLEEIEESWPED